MGVCPTKAVGSGQRLIMAHNRHQLLFFLTLEKEDGNPLLPTAMQGQEEGGGGHDGGVMCLAQAMCKTTETTGYVHSSRGLRALYPRLILCFGLANPGGACPLLG